MRQLQLASILYAGDNNDFIPKNQGKTVSGSGIIGETPNEPNWVAGSFGTPGPTGDSPGGVQTNTFLLGVQGDTDAAYRDDVAGFDWRLYQKRRRVSLPGGRSLDPTSKLPRARSCSMNCYMGTNPRFYKFSTQIDNTYRAYFKYSDFNASLAASDAFMFLDENPASLNDGYFNIFPNSINDRPAVNHGNSSAFTFADGHAQLHKWQDTYLLPSGGSPNSIDHTWLKTHASMPND